MEVCEQVLVPDYFPAFHCKCGDCRTSCCSGWGISIPRTEYFKLLSVDCSPELRSKLDSAFHVLPDATPERYAKNNPSWWGNCRLQREDGWCGLQCECGEGVLPSVCRLYPRGLRTAYQPMLCTSNSCEGTLELLFRDPAPLTFLTIPRPAGLADPDTPLAESELGKYIGIRDRVFGLLTDRTLPLPHRLLRLGQAVSALEAWDGCGELVLPDFVLPEPAQLAPLTGQLALMRELAEDSDSMGEYTSQIFAALGVDQETMQTVLDRYHQGCELLETRFPHWQDWMEKAIINHLFFGGFPHSTRRQGLRKQYVALCGVYGLIRFAAAGWMPEHEGMDALVDVLAASFRLIEHSAFGWNAPIVLRDVGISEDAALADLVLNA